MHKNLQFRPVVAAGVKCIERDRKMNDQHTIVYVMRHIDIGGHIEIPYKKLVLPAKVTQL